MLQVSVPTWRKSERISFIDSQLQKTLAVTTYEPRGVLSVHKSRVARLEDTIGVDGSGVESAHCHSMRTFILAKSGLLYSTGASGLGFAGVACGPREAMRACT